MGGKLSKKGKYDPERKNKKKKSSEKFIFKKHHERDHFFYDNNRRANRADNLRITSSAPNLTQLRDDSWRSPKTRLTVDALTMKNSEASMRSEDFETISVSLHYIPDEENLYEDVREPETQISRDLDASIADIDIEEVRQKLKHIKKRIKSFDGKEDYMDIIDDLDECAEELNAVETSSDHKHDLNRTVKNFKQAIMDKQTKLNHLIKNNEDISDTGQEQSKLHFQSVVKLFADVTHELDAIKEEILNYYGTSEDAEYAVITSRLNRSARIVKEVDAKSNVHIVLTKEQYEDYINRLKKQFEVIVEESEKNFTLQKTTLSTMDRNRDRRRRSQILEDNINIKEVHGRLSVDHSSMYRPPRLSGAVEGVIEEEQDIYINKSGEVPTNTVKAEEEQLYVSTSELEAESKLDEQELYSKVLKVDDSQMLYEKLPSETKVKPLALFDDSPQKSFEDEEDFDAVLRKKESKSKPASPVRRTFLKQISGYSTEAEDEFFDCEEFLDVNEFAANETFNEFNNFTKAEPIEASTNTASANQKLPFIDEADVIEEKPSFKSIFGRSASNEESDNQVEYISVVGKKKIENSDPPRPTSIDRSSGQLEYFSDDAEEHEHLKTVHNEKRKLLRETGTVEDLENIQNYMKAVKPIAVEEEEEDLQQPTVAEESTGGAKRVKTPRKLSTITMKYIDGLKHDYAESLKDLSPALDSEDEDDSFSFIEVINRGMGQSRDKKNGNVGVDRSAEGKGSTVEADTRMEERKSDEVASDRKDIGDTAKVGETTNADNSKNRSIEGNAIDDSALYRTKEDRDADKTSEHFDRNVEKRESNQSDLYKRTEGNGIGVDGRNHDTQETEYRGTRTDDQNFGTDEDSDEHFEDVDITGNNAAQENSSSLPSYQTHEPDIFARSTTDEEELIPSKDANGSKGKDELAKIQKLEIDDQEELTNHHDIFGRSITREESIRSNVDANRSKGKGVLAKIQQLDIDDQEELTDHQTHKPGVFARSIADEEFIPSKVDANGSEDKDVLAKIQKHQTDWQEELTQELSIFARSIIDEEFIRRNVVAKGSKGKDAADQIAKLQIDDQEKLTDHHGIFAKSVTDEESIQSNIDANGSNGKDVVDKIQKLQINGQEKLTDATYQNQVVITKPSVPAMKNFEDREVPSTNFYKIPVGLGDESTYFSGPISGGVTNKSSGDESSYPSRPISEGVRNELSVDESSYLPGPISDGVRNESSEQETPDLHASNYKDSLHQPGGFMRDKSNRNATAEERKVKSASVISFITDDEINAVTDDGDQPGGFMRYKSNTNATAEERKVKSASVISFITDEEINAVIDDGVQSGGFMRDKSNRNATADERKEKSASVISVITDDEINAVVDNDLFDDDRLYRKFPIAKLIEGVGQKIPDPRSSKSNHEDSLYQAGFMRDKSNRNATVEERKEKSASVISFITDEEINAVTDDVQSGGFMRDKSNRNATAEERKEKSSSVISFITDDEINAVTHTDLLDDDRLFRTFSIGRYTDEEKRRRNRNSEETRNECKENSSTSNPKDFDEEYKQNTEDFSDNKQKHHVDASNPMNFDEAYKQNTEDFSDNKRKHRFGASNPKDFDDNIEDFSNHKHEHRVDASNPKDFDDNIEDFSDNKREHRVDASNPKDFDDNIEDFSDNKPEHRVGASNSKDFDEARKQKIEDLKDNKPKHRVVDHIPSNPHEMDEGLKLRGLDYTTKKSEDTEDLIAKGIFGETNTPTNSELIKKDELKENTTKAAFEEMNIPKNSTKKSEDTEDLIAKSIFGETNTPTNSELMKKDELEENTIVSFPDLLGQASNTYSFAELLSEQLKNFDEDNGKETFLIDPLSTDLYATRRPPSAAPPKTPRNSEVMPSDLHEQLRNKLPTELHFINEDHEVYEDLNLSPDKYKDLVMFQEKDAYVKTPRGKREDPSAVLEKYEDIHSPQHHNIFQEKNTFLEKPIQDINASTKKFLASGKSNASDRNFEDVSGLDTYSHGLQDQIDFNKSPEDNRNHYQLYENDDNSLMHLRNSKDTKNEETVPENSKQFSKLKDHDDSVIITPQPFVKNRQLNDLLKGLIIPSKEEKTKQIIDNPINPFIAVNEEERESKIINPFIKNPKIVAPSMISRDDSKDSILPFDLTDHRKTALTDSESPFDITDHKIYKKTDSTSPFDITDNKETDLKDPTSLFDLTDHRKTGLVDSLSPIGITDHKKTALIDSTSPVNLTDHRITALTDSISPFDITDHKNHKETVVADSLSPFDITDHKKTDRIDLTSPIDLTNHKRTSRTDSLSPVDTIDHKKSVPTDSISPFDSDHRRTPRTDSISPFDITDHRKTGLTHSTSPLDLTDHKRTDLTDYISPFGITDSKQTVLTDSKSPFDLSGNRKTAPADSMSPFDITGHRKTDSKSKRTDLKLVDLYVDSTNHRGLDKTNLTDNRDAVSPFGSADHKQLVSTAETESSPLSLGANSKNFKETDSKNKTTDSSFELSDNKTGKTFLDFLDKKETDSKSKTTGLSFELSDYKTDEASSDFLDEERDVVPELPSLSSRSYLSDDDAADIETKLRTVKECMGEINICIRYFEGSKNDEEYDNIYENLFSAMSVLNKIKSSDWDVVQEKQNILEEINRCMNDLEAMTA